MNATELDAAYTAARRSPNDQRHRHRSGNRSGDGRIPGHYVPATKLVNKLVEAADEKQLTKTIARHGRVDLLCIDELGHMELDRRGTELPFQVLPEREKKNSVASASNESFGG